MTYMKAILAGAILGVSAIIPTQVQATDWYAVACITSATGDIVNFSYRWGSNDWKAINVNPGEWHFMSWQYEFYLFGNQIRVRELD
jgi:hypothetical protein